MLNTTAAVPETEHSQICPACSAVIPVLPNYVTWCDQCGWNLDPSPPAPARTFLERFYQQLGRRSGEQLFKAAMLPASFSLSRILALAAALLVHIATIALLLAGIALLVRSNWNVMLLLFGGVCLGLVWIARPDFGRMPERHALAKDYPTLHAVTRRIADALGVKRTPLIVLTSDFNASFAELGLRRIPVLSLGVPLLAVLTPAERVALLAHELAHSVNGDPGRSFLVGSALETLASWHAVFQPDALSRNIARHTNRSVGGFYGFFGNLVANIVMPLLGGLPWLGMFGLSHLLWRDSQRAEYRADLLAAKVSGGAAMLGLLQKLHYRDAVHASIQRVVLAVPAHEVHKQPLINAIRADTAQLPARELERIRRIQLHAGSRLDATHPPTPLRVRQLESQTGANGSVSISQNEQEQIDAELRQVEGKVARELSDLFRSRLYY